MISISHGYTGVLHPGPPSHLTPSHPSELSQGTSFECPVSCIKSRLVICFTYGNIHVSMLFSQIITPSPSPTECKSLFFTSVSLLLSRILGHCYHLSKFHMHALKNNYHECLDSWETHRNNKFLSCTSNKWKSPLTL